MRFEKALIYYRKGKKIRRKSWQEGLYFSLIEITLPRDYLHLTHEILYADDWEVKK